MRLHYRTLRADEEELIVRFAGLVFAEQGNPDDIEALRTLYDFQRMLGAFDQDGDGSYASASDGALAGLTASLSFEMTVPGGRQLPTAGVTQVGVRPTHRRRGILRELMRLQLDEIRDRGEPLAALFASEAPIYGRFGYGVACFNERWEIDADRSAFRQGISPKGQVSMVSSAVAQRTFPSVHAGHALQRPGMVNRNEAWWRWLLRDEATGEGVSRKFLVLYESDNGPEGYARYMVDANAHDEQPEFSVRLQELVGNTPDAHASLWRFCLDLDLVKSVRCSYQPADDPLPWMLRDTRALRRTVVDHMHLRLVDVPAALRARAYGEEDSLVLEVRDGSCPWNEGTYRLEGGEAGAECARTGRKPDLSLDAEILGALYLGGTPAVTLRDARLLDERTPGAVDRMDRMFNSRVSPWPGLFW